MNLRPAAEARQRRARVILLILGPLLLGFSAVFALHTWLFLLRSARAVGTVTELRVDFDDQHRETNYAPVFAFTARDGRNYAVVSDTWANPPAFSTGDRVPVRYLADDPHTAKIATFWQLWSFPVVFGLVGSAFAGASLFLSLYERRKSGQARNHMGPMMREIPRT
ncbi:MAG: DUF3592 domain-containing protein [Acidobacteriaceae bacterium]